jgi:hypothetical protein
LARLLLSARSGSDNGPERCLRRQERRSLPSAARTRRAERLFPHLGRIPKPEVVRTRSSSATRTCTGGSKAPARLTWTRRAGAARSGGFWAPSATATRSSASPLTAAGSRREMGGEGTASVLADRLSHVRSGQEKLLRNLRWALWLLVSDLLAIPISSTIRWRTLSTAVDRPWVARYQKFRPT